MRFRSFTLAAALLPVMSTGQAQDAFQFTYPEPNSEIALNTYQTVRVQWLRDSDPVFNGTVALRTDLGVIEDEVTRTGPNGVATFAIRSTTAGIATLHATTPDLPVPGAAELVVRFSGTVKSDQPFGDLAVQRSLENQLPLWILTDRIGFLARDGVSIEDVATIAADEKVFTQLTPLGERIFVLKVDNIPAVDPEPVLRGLARELEKEHSEIFRAGLVAQIVGTRQWLVVPDQVIAKFESELSSGAIEELINQLDPHPIAVEQAALDSSRYVITLDVAGDGALESASQLSSMGQVIYAEPNYVIPIDLRGDPKTDAGYGYQWHHENAGTYATEDADIDSARAWSFGYDTSDVTVAVIDRGFDIDHPDLVDNLLCGPDEWCANFGKRAINVTASDPDPTKLLSSSPNEDAFSHGTRAAGVAAERGGNNIGYSGACPQCRLMLIRNEESLDSVVTAFEEAINRNVDVISNSWGFTLGSGSASASAPTVMNGIVNAINAAVDEGITVVFAMTNEKLDNCGALPDISSLPKVIGVSGITDYDERSYVGGEALGYGTCMDVLAPTRGGEKGIRTTSVMKLPGPTSTYWHDFSGTSAATPMVAGVIGLMKSFDRNLSPLRIQRILQDTADRVDPQHADYSPESGFSNPGGTPTHGYGRINAYEATRLVAPVSPRTTELAAGRSGRDLVLRDHGLDWGNTEQPSDVIFDSPRKQYTLHQSADIKIDVEPFQPVTNDPAGFVKLDSEEPEIGKQLQVFVRVRNRGPHAVQSADLKLHYAVVTDTFPDLTLEFWANFPADVTSSAWTPLPSTQLAGLQYSGASVAGCPARPVPACLASGTASVTAPVVDAAQIATFKVPPLDWDAAAGERLALLAVVNSEQDPLQAKLSPGPAWSNVVAAVTRDNNVTLWIPGTETAECAPWIEPLILVLLTLTVILIVWIIWRWITGQPVAIGVYLALVIVIALLIALRLAFPECFAMALDRLGL